MSFSPSAKRDSKFNIGLVQMSCGTDAEENLQKAIQGIRDAAAKGAEIVCLQELFRSQYFCREEKAELFDLAETIPGPSTEAISSIARELQVSVVASLFEKRAQGLYHNTAAIIDADGSLVGTYRKMHIPDDPLYYEKFYFTPGDLGFKNFETKYSRIGVLVCWDQWYPEGARITSLQGANVLFYPTAIGWHPSEKAEFGEAQLDAWRTMQRAHAIANGVFVAAVNRTGFEGSAESGLEFWGNSFISDPFGRVIQQASAAEETVLVAECDPKHMDEVRRNWPFLRDRRIDAYGADHAALAGLTEMPDDLTVKPAEAGFRMPAEWETHEATWLAWPHEITDWPGKFATIQWVYCEIVRHLSRMEKVRILVQDAEVENKVKRVLRKSGAQMTSVEFFRYPTDRSWTRDFCPIFVKNSHGMRGVLNWQFNGWAKYPNSANDDAVTEKIAREMNLPMWTPTCEGRRVVLEGGSIDVNGAGSILTTEECLLSDVQARNPGLSRAEMEQILADNLGARHTLWLRNGIAGDDTHGHVDDLARFTDAWTVVIAAEEDPSEVNYAPLEENLALLKELRDQDGQPFRIETLPMPEPIYFDGQRLPASYANFYIANHVVLVPTFNDAKDRIALNKLAELFPARKVVGIAATDLVLGLGTLHCMTQQQPA